MESFAVAFPRIWDDASFRGWFVSSLLIFAWFGSLINGPIADSIGRKGSMMLAVVIFVIGSVFQTAAWNIGSAFAGRAIAGLAVGMLTMIVPMYLSEVSLPGIRGTLVVLQQLSITLGIMVSYWLEYGYVATPKDLHKAFELTRRTVLNTSAAIVAIQAFLTPAVRSPSLASTLTTMLPLVAAPAKATPPGESLWAFRSSLLSCWALA